MLDVDLHHGASTDVGLVRKVNEDSYLVAPPVFVNLGRCITLTRSRQTAATPAPLQHR